MNQDIINQCEVQKRVFNAEAAVMGGHHTMSQDRTSKPEIPATNHLLLSTTRYKSQDEKRDQSLNNLGQLLVYPPTRITRKNPKNLRRENVSQENHYQSIVLYICILSHIAISLSLFFVDLQAHTRNKGTNEHDWKETAVSLETSINT
jgi:hypothetical protein